MDFNMRVMTGREGGRWYASATGAPDQYPRANCVAYGPTEAEAIKAVRKLIAATIKYYYGPAAKHSAPSIATR